LPVVPRYAAIDEQLADQDDTAASRKAASRCGA
jgi:hypothetical protein